MEIRTMSRKVNISVDNLPDTLRGQIHGVESAIDNESLALFTDNKDVRISIENATFSCGDFRFWIKFETTSWQTVNQPSREEIHDWHCKWSHTSRESPEGGVLRGAMHNFRSTTPGSIKSSGIDRSWTEVVSKIWICSKTRSNHEIRAFQSGASEITS